MFSFFLNILPDSFLEFIFYSFFFGGVTLIVASWFVKFIPLINKYRFPTQIIGIVVFGFGCYLLGGLGIERVWRERVKELEAKVKDAEVRSQQVNTVIQEKIVYKTKIVEKKTVQYVDRIKEIAKEVDAKCEVDPRIVESINKASEDPSKESK
jgi:hypothetical protein